MVVIDGLEAIKEMLEECRLSPILSDNIIVADIEAKILKLKELLIFDNPTSAKIPEWAKERIRHIISSILWRFESEDMDT